MELRNYFWTLIAACVLAALLLFAYQLGEDNGYQLGYREAMGENKFWE